jgi:hypothetical protein
MSPAPYVRITWLSTVYMVSSIFKRFFLLRCRKQFCLFTDAAPCLRWDWNPRPFGWESDVLTIRPRRSTIYSPEMAVCLLVDCNTIHHTQCSRKQAAHSPPSHAASSGFWRQVLPRVERTLAAGVLPLAARRGLIWLRQKTRLAARGSTPGGKTRFF